MSDKREHRILFVASHRPDRAPNQRFRFEQYIPYLEANGFECELSYLVDEATDRKLYEKGHYLSKLAFVLSSYRKRKKDLRRIEDYDIVFVAREAMMIGSTFFERAVSRSSSKLVYDIDDAVWLSNVSPHNARFQWVKGQGKAHRIFPLADLILAGNAYLADEAKPFNSNVEIFPTTVDTEHHQRASVERDDRICIGWTGSLTTVPHFELAVPVLERIREQYGDKVCFKLIGDASYWNEKLQFQGLPWRKESEVADLSDIDIGIMPLPDTEWAKGKCGLKALQFMALETPPVVSPVGVNTEIVEDGVNGAIAGSEEEWVEKLSRLIEAEELRREMGGQARRTVEERYSVEANKERFLELLGSLGSSPQHT